MDTELKKLFNKRKKFARQNFEAGQEFNRLMNRVYGFTYSDTDDDFIIDTLDYGINSISFETFEAKMKIYKERFDNDKPFGLA